MSEVAAPLLPAPIHRPRSAPFHARPSYTRATMTTTNTLTLPNGDTMPALGLGTWKSEPGEVAGAVRTALEIGYRHIDCASIYGNEAEIGEALFAAIDGGAVARDELWVTSKLWNNSHAPEDVRPALEQTLADLRLESLDLYLMHWPIALTKGTLIPDFGDCAVVTDETSSSITSVVRSISVFYTVSGAKGKPCIVKSCQHPSA